MATLNSDMHFRLIHKIAKKCPVFFSNYPLLSSLNFSKIVKLNLPADEENWRHEDIKTAKSIFVQSEKLETLLNILKIESVCQFILCGNSDRNIFELDVEIPASVKTIFIQNSFILNNYKIQPLPIGIESISYARNGFKWTMKRSKFKTIKKLLVGPFGPTNKIRSDVLHAYNLESEKHVRVDFPMSPLRYAKIHRKFAFTLCPRGNGEDTHRVWESLYRGSWPILERNNWSIKIAEKYPVILVDSILDGKAIFSEVSKAIYSKPPTLIPSLFLPYWKELIE